MSAIVELRGLTKSYGNMTAVQDMTFSIERNKIYGFLGRNGAGKTTIMHMITAQLFPTSGELRVFGEAPYENNRVLSQICFIKESLRYPDSFRVADVLAVSAELFPNWDAAYAESLLEEFRLPKNRNMKKLSRGMLSSVGIVIGLASRAPLTIFDEPYLGLDAVSRELFYDRLIEDYAENPRTVILSTHLIDEVARLLEHVILIDGGRLLIDEEADALRGMAYTIVGPAAKVEAFAAGKEIIHREPLGGLATATLLGALRPEERRQAIDDGLELAPVSLQQLIVHLTNQNTGRKAVESV